MEDVVSRWLDGKFSRKLGPAGPHLVFFLSLVSWACTRPQKCVAGAIYKGLHHPVPFPRLCLLPHPGSSLGSTSLQESLSHPQ